MAFLSSVRAELHQGSQFPTATAGGQMNAFMPKENNHISMLGHFQGHRVGIVESCM